MPGAGGGPAGPRPSSVTVSRTCSAAPTTTNEQVVALLWRTTLVTVSRTTQPSSASACGVIGGPERWTTASIPAAVNADLARSSSVARLPSR